MTPPADFREYDRQMTARWLALSIGALMLAGLFSIGLIIGRVPPFSEWVTDPKLFKRFLVIHVDLALIVWFYAFLAGLFQLIGSRTGGHRAAARGLGPALLGIIAMVSSGLVPNAEPILANYVPVVDHPLFIFGLVSFAIGVLSALASRRMFPSDDAPSFFELPEDARPALRAAAVALAAAALTFYGAFLATPRTLPDGSYYELVAWGGGHVLQVASEAGMMAVWLILLGTLLKRPVIGRKWSAILFALLVTPHLAMPALTLFGTDSAAYHVGATRLMQFGIFPVVLVVLGLCVRQLVIAYRAGELEGRLTDPRLIGFATSAALTLTGFALGAMIRGSNTMIPAHYHAAIGAVTVSFMTLAIVLLAPERYDICAPGLLRGTRPIYAPIRDRWRKLQPALFGGGQVIFAIGFGLAGANGMARKAYGSDQYVRGFADWLGLGIMGFGGLIAIAGGLLFMIMVVQSVTAVARNRKTDSLPTRRSFANRRSA